MIDLNTVSDQSHGLATFTVIAGLGGAVGYAIGGNLLTQHLGYEENSDVFSQGIIDMNRNENLCERT